MSYINKDATLAAIANKAKAELADVNHYVLEGVQLAVDVVEGMERADVVPVVHCGDCRYWERMNPYATFGLCAIWRDIQRRASDYCSEAREDGNG